MHEQFENAGEITNAPSTHPRRCVFVCASIDAFFSRKPTGLFHPPPLIMQMPFYSSALICENNFPAIHFRFYLCSNHTQKNQTQNTKKSAGCGYFFPRALRS